MKIAKTLIKQKGFFIYLFICCCLEIYFIPHSFFGKSVS